MENAYIELLEFTAFPIAICCIATHLSAVLHTDDMDIARGRRQLFPTPHLSADPLSQSSDFEQEESVQNLLNFTALFNFLFDWMRCERLCVLVLFVRVCKVTKNDRMGNFRLTADDMHAGGGGRSRTPAKTTTATEGIYAPSIRAATVTRDSCMCNVHRTTRKHSNRQ